MIFHLYPSMIIMSRTPPPQKPTPRQLEVLKLVAAGYSSKQIADMLYISVTTVHTHRRDLLSTLKCKNTTQAYDICKQYFDE